ncbi:MAG: PKD domain-containing protein [Candidatus Latescibacterota bacterium]
MRRGLVFLARFVLVAGLLYGVWPWLAPAYLCLVAPGVNTAFASLDLPVLLELRGSVALLAYRTGDGWLRLQAHGYDVVYLNLLSAVALIAAWPGRPLRWRLRWAGGVGSTLWLTHVCTFLASGQMAVWQYLDALPPGPDRQALLERLAPHFPRSRAQFVSHLVAQWDMWGRYALVVVAWITAVRWPQAFAGLCGEPAPRGAVLRRTGEADGRRRARGRAPQPAGSPAPAWVRYGPVGAIVLALLTTLASCEGPPAAPLIPPVASAGTDQRAQVDQSVVLDGSGSRDAGEGTLSYAWVQLEGPVVGIQGAHAARALVVAVEAGVYVFRLTVTSSEGVSAADEVLVLVLPADSSGPDAGKPGDNTPPRAHAGRDQQVEPGQPVILDGGASFDAESADLQYAWVQVSGPTTVGIEAADSPWATVVPALAGEYLFRLTVTDGQGASGMDEVRLVAAAPEHGSTLRLVAAPIGAGVARAEYTVAAAGEDTLRGTLVITDDRVGRKTLLGMPAGGERLVEIHAYDAAGRLVAFGSAMADVPDGEVVDVAIEMRSLLPQSGGIIVEAVFSDAGG